MAKPTVDGGSKFTGLFLTPEEIKIIGLDVPVPSDPAHPLAELADPDRINLDVSDIAQSFFTHGWRGAQAVTVLKWPGDATAPEGYYAVDGRRRIRGARKANEMIKAAGGDAYIRVQAGLERNKSALPTVIVTNEFRVDDTILAKARKAERMANLNHTQEQIAATFGVAKQTIGNWATMLRCDARILAMVEQGTLSPTVCYELGKLAPAEQLAAVESARAEATAAGTDPAKALKGQTGRKRAQGKKGGFDSDRWSVSEIRALQGMLDQDKPEDGDYEEDAMNIARALLAIILGDRKTADGLKDWPELRKYVARILRSAKADE